MKLTLSPAHHLFNHLGVVTYSSNVLIFDIVSLPASHLYCSHFHLCVSFIYSYSTIWPNCLLERKKCWASIRRQIWTFFLWFIIYLISCNKCVQLEYNFSLQQAKYDDIKKVVKAAAEGPMKGILGYTDHQVFFLFFFPSYSWTVILIRIVF